MNFENKQELVDFLKEELKEKYDPRQYANGLELSVNQDGDAEVEACHTIIGRAFSVRLNWLA